MRGRTQAGACEVDLDDCGMELGMEEVYTGEDIVGGVGLHKRRIDIRRIHVDRRGERRIKERETRETRGESYSQTFIKTLATTFVWILD
jgi:hypothetical protein